MNENFVYRYGDNLYINLTNKCCNACDFCIRNNGDGIGDSGNLWLSREPSASEVCALIDTFGDYNEIVFCGYGEPTYKMDEIVAVAKHVHGLGKKTRLNTNGLGNLINGRDIVPELKEAIDVISISLNSDNAKGYDEVCHSIYGEQAFDEIIAFTEKCVKTGMKTVMSVVAVEGIDVEKCRAVTEKIGATLKVREYIA